MTCFAADSRTGNELQPWEDVNSEMKRRELVLINVLRFTHLLIGRIQSAHLHKNIDLPVNAPIGILFYPTCLCCLVGKWNF